MIPAIIIAISIVIVLIVLYILNEKRYENFARNNSVAIKKLRELNAEFMFFPRTNFNLTHTYDNENFYNDISCDDYLIYNLQFTYRKIMAEISKINSNAKNYQTYSAQVKAIETYGEYALPYGKLNLEKLKKYERKLFSSTTLLHPATVFILTVKLYLSTINGDVYRSKQKNFGVEQIELYIRHLNNKNGSFYRDRAIWDSICRVERGKVSNKMRFAIYKRDGYRCRYCGASDKYTTLEIDHIIPISKGGKTTYGNLQTLCHDCNVRKGDSV